MQTHRGFEIVTYFLNVRMRHKDNACHERRLEAVYNAVDDHLQSDITLINTRVVRSFAKVISTLDYLL